jgi:NADH-quinone oxidoreductase subunit G
MQPLVTLTIDGQSVSVPPGTTILEAARGAGIDIPTLCYHAKLSKLGACRLCLVEVERMKAPQTACTTAVRPEMVVRTNTPDILKARRGMLEFLLTNHPLDCPVCDAGGECELQDATFRYGPGVSRYVEEKREKAKALPLGPTIIMDEERCILCRRCVRFLEEYADDVKLGYFERGRLTYLSIFPEHQLIGKFMGNVVALCPVGALTSRTFRFQARCWQLKSAPSICTQCGVGCNTEVGVKADTLRRVSGRENLAVNDIWLCDKGRFSYGFVHGADRVRTPLIRRDGELTPATWDEALQHIAGRLNDVVHASGPDSVGGLGSGAATNEANYLLQRVLRGVIGTNNVDHVGRLPENALPLDMNRLAQADLVLLVGVDATEEAPVVELRLRHEALTRGLQVLGLGARRVHSARRFGSWLPVRPGDEVAVLSGLARLLQKDDRGAGRTQVANVADLTESLAAFGPEQVEKWTAVPAAALLSAGEKLRASRNVLILYGALAASRPAILQAVNNLALALGASTSVSVAALAPEANTRGALDMGVVPTWLPGRQPVDDARVRDRLAKAWHAKLSTKPGLDVAGMKAALLSGQLKTLYVMRSDPAAELPGWKKALQAPGALVVVQELFLTETAKLAEVVLPSASNVEEDGTYTGLTGRVQRVRQCVPLQGEARADWQILTALARTMDAELGYGGPDQVMREAARIGPLYEEATWEQIGAGGRSLRYPDLARKPAKVEYSPAPAKEGYPFVLALGRALFDGGLALMQTPAFEPVVPEPYVEMNPADAAQASIKDGFRVKIKSSVGTVAATARLTEDVCPGCVFLPLRLRDALAVVLLEDAPVTHVTVARG